MANRRDIEVVIAGRYEGKSAFAAAKSDMQAMLAQARETRQQLSPFGQLVARADAQDSGMQSAIESRARAQAQLSQELAASRSKSLAQEQTAIMAAAQAERREMLRVAADRRSIQDRMYAASHTAQEVELRQLRHYYARMRLEHRGNAAMMAQIDRAYQSERAGIVLRGGPGGAGGGLAAAGMAAGAGGNGAFTRQQVAFAMTNAVGRVAPGAGEVLTSAAMGGSAAAAGITAGLVAAVALYREAGQHARALTEAHKAYGDAVADSARWWDRLSAAMTTSRGSAAEGRMDQMDQAAAAAAAKARELEDQSRTLMGGVTRLGANALAAVGLNDGSDLDQAIAKNRDLARHYSEQAEAAEKLARTQRDLAAARALADQQDQTASAILAGRYGPDDADQLRRAQLEMSQARELRKAREANQDRPGSIDMDELERRQRIEKGNLEAQIEQKNQQQLFDDIGAAREARIRATSDGYERELALLRLKHAKELEEAQAAGRSRKFVLERQAAEREELAKREAQRLVPLNRQMIEAMINGSFKGIEAERQLLTLRQRARIEDAKGDAERAIARQINASEAQQFDRNIAERNKAEAYGVVQARLALLSSGNEREMAMLRLKHMQEREAAEQQGLDITLVAARQQAEILGLGRRMAAAGVQVSEGGWHRMAPGSEGKSLVDQHYDRLAAELVTTNDYNSQSVTLLKQILDALGVTQTATLPR